MALNFPSSPTDGYVWRPGGNLPNYVYRTAKGAWTRPAGTAIRPNRIVNPTFQIAQPTADPVGIGGYPVDQWFFDASPGAAGTILRLADAVNTVGGWCISGTVSVAVPTLAAGDYYSYCQRIEGTRIADFNWGPVTSSLARAAVLRFRAYSEKSGTYTVAIRNGTSSRSFLAPFTLVANTWTTVVISVPGDILTTWTVDTGMAMIINFVFACGTTYGSGVAGWQAGNHLGIAGMTNGITAAAGNGHRIADVGLWVDPNNTGLAPEFIVPNYEDDLADCQRYWYPCFMSRGVISGTLQGHVQAVHPVPMRIAPALSIVGAPRLYDTTVAPTITSISSNPSNNMALYAVMVTAGTFVLGRPAMQLSDGVQYTKYIAVNARM